MKKIRPREINNRTKGLWFHVGLRLQNKRVQMGLTEDSVAAHLGVPLATYQSFEAGRTETPAEFLARLADYFEVSIFSFFQDVLYGEINPRPSPSIEPAPAFTIATDEDREAALLSDFRKMNRQQQQCLFLVARVLVEDTREE